MNKFGDLLGTQISQSLNKSLGLTYQISTMLKTQEQFSRDFSGLSKIAELSKVVNRQSIYASPTMSAIEAMTKSIGRYQSKFAIPHSAIEAIATINRRHEQLYKGISTLTEAIKIQSPAIAQLSNLYSALNGLSGQISAIAVRQKNWALIDDFEKVTEEVIDFTEGLTAEVEEEQKKNFQILLTLIISFLDRHKVGVSVLLIIDIFLRFAEFNQYFDFLKHKPEPLTREEINHVSIKQDSILSFIGIVSQQLKQSNEYRITDKKCDVKLKPTLKTITLTKLPADFEVIIIQTHHKWVYASYFDPKDNLPQTGWIMKKYLTNPKVKH